MRPSSTSLRAPLGALAAAGLIFALAALPAGAAQPAAPEDPTAGAAQSTPTGRCVALRRSTDGKKFIKVTARVYKYKYVRIRKGRSKGKYRRTIVRVKRNVLVSCARQCVRTVKKKGKYRPVRRWKRVTVKRIRRVTVKRRRNGRTVRVRERRIVKRKVRKRVYVYGKCPAGVGAELGTPVRIDVLPGSYALLDFGAFQRQAAVSGSLRGFVPGKIQLNSDIQVTLNRGTLSLAQTPVFIDDDCDGRVSAAIRTGNPATIGLNPGRTSTATLLKTGTATSIVYSRIRLPLELRNGELGCTKPYISTGYREFDQTFFLRGRVGVGGLTRLQLVSAPDTLAVEACLAPGSPTLPCNGFAIPLPILVSTKLTVNLDLSGK